MLKKKEIGLLLLLAGILSSGYAMANRYEAFKVGGKVLIDHNGKWDAVKPHQPLDGSSVIKIEPNSTFGIKDNNTKSIYYGTDAGEFSVIKFVMNAKKEMQQKTSAIVRTLGNSVSSNSVKRKAVLGVTNRGLGDASSSPSEDKIKEGSLEYVLNELIGGNVPPSIGLPHTLKGKVNVDSDSIASYEIEFPAGKDVSDRFYFINVVKISNEAVPQFMFPSGVKGELLSIAEGEKLNVDWYPTVYDPHARYFLFVSEEPYRVETLQNILNSVKNGDGNALQKFPLDKELRQSPVWIFEINS